MVFLKEAIGLVVISLMMLWISPSIQAADNEVGFKNLASGLSYEWSEEPESSYPDNENKLTDGVYGELDKSDPAWVGHLQKKTREVVFDLGEKKSIASIKAHFLQDYPTSSILVPLTVSFYVSNDKENWGTLSHNATQLLWGAGPPRDEQFIWDGSKDGIKNGDWNGTMAYARYVKVTFSMHPTHWSFIDEIEIWGAEGKLEGAQTVPPEQPAYLQPGEETAGIENLVLLYNGHYPDGKGDWSKERILPNISYIDQEGEPQDWFHDGVLYLGLHSPKGGNFGGQSNPGADLDDWKWYLNKTFAAEGDLQQLNEAAKEAGIKLNEPDHKVKVVLMIPDPGESLTDFGDVDGDGISENFNAGEVGKELALANRKKVVKWWIEEVIQRWQAEDFSQLNLAGLYWLEEQISTSNTGPDLLKHTSDIVHDQDLKLFWIPHFLSHRSHIWEDVGIDATALQPNYFFEELEPDRLEDAANTAKQFGMGVEIEFDDRMLSDGIFRQRFIEYLNSGVKFGYMENSFKAFYQGNNAIYDTAVSKDPATRILYDWLYQFSNGTYEINEEPAPEAKVKINGEPLQDGVIVPDSESIQFTWKVESEGPVKVTALFDGKAYEEGEWIDLAGMPGKHELVVTASAGKVKKDTYLIEVSTSAADMNVLVDRLHEAGEFKNYGAARALQVHLESVEHFEKKGSAEKVAKHLKGFNILLENQMKQQHISESAHRVLREDLYYLIGSVALNKEVESSSIEGGNLNYTADKAVDGYISSRWASDYVDNAWFLVDLGKIEQMDTVKIDWENAYAKRYKILVSNDKEHWENIKKDNGGIIEGNGGKEVIHFDKVNARYVKFEGVERATGYGYSFYEFGVYNIGN
ncbi:DUF4855 domain-containing protein [Bacillus sp. SD088]|uniref:DUF4855 domain-containing protein n=1 Tax=Bacillus sp. SD088 TaxID=2782012 RepID=UPI001A9591A2|nr:DUF4855 domain-containing protein [Bacillus sp. SD088]MBO0991764.1 DUF4855 domain-containing protein [Bacillus sp. SD088]